MASYGSTSVTKSSIKECTVSLFGAHELHFALTFAEDEIQPLFSGGCWAGTVVWKASLYLCEHLKGIDIRNKDILELGAGVGLPGMAAAYLGARSVLLTEQDPLAKLLETNVAKNFKDARSIVVPKVELLDWNDVSGNPATSYDIILISDCIYEQLYGDSWRALAQVLKKLAKPGTLILNAVERRNEDGIDKFNNYVVSLGFSFDLVSKHSSAEREELELYQLRLLHKNGSS